MHDKSACYYWLYFYLRQIDHFFSQNTSHLYSCCVNVAFILKSLYLLIRFKQIFKFELIMLYTRQQFMSSVNLTRLMELNQLREPQSNKELEAIHLQIKKATRKEIRNLKIQVSCYSGPYKEVLEAAVAERELYYLVLQRKKRIDIIMQSSQKKTGDIQSFFSSIGSLMPWTSSQSAQIQKKKVQLTISRYSPNRPEIFNKNHLHLQQEQQQLLSKKELNLSNFTFDGPVAKNIKKYKQS